MMVCVTWTGWISARCAAPYFLSREAVTLTKRIGMARWREGVFAFLLKDANSNVRFFNLPLNRVIELGTQVEI